VREIEWCPYLPEVDRYGGDAAMQIAERVFCDSSRAAVRLLGALNGPPARLGRALGAMITALYVFCPARAEIGRFAHVRAALHGTANTVRTQARS